MNLNLKENVLWKFEKLLREKVTSPNEHLLITIPEFWNSYGEE